MNARHAAQQAVALGIGAVSGFTAYIVGMPLPWMIGAMIGVTIAALSSLPVRGPDKLRNIVIPIIGVMLGSAVDADTFSNLGSWVGSLAVLPLMLFGVAAASYLIYRRMGSYDPVTAFYCSMPGGLNEMLILGEDAGGDARKIALAHAARVLFVIMVVALIFAALFSVRTGSGGAAWVPLDAISALDYAILTACAVVGVPIGKLLRLPAAQVFGPMILSAIAHLLEWVIVAPPTLFIVSAQVVVGTIIGCRFIDTRLRDLGKDMGLALIATVLMLAVSSLFAWLLALVNGMPLQQVFLSFAPGGLTEMSLLTLAIGQDIAFVSVIHLVRITLVIGVAPTLFAQFQRFSPSD